MKKILGISLVAVLTATPLMAGATDVTLITPNAATTDVASTSYVKGAYNALGEVINTKQDKLSQEQLDAISGVGDLQTRMTAAEGDIDNLESGKADKATTLAGYGITDAYTKTESDTNYATAAQGATADATAATVATYGDVVTHNAAEFATAAQGAKADTALQAADLADYATKTGVDNTIKAATITISGGAIANGAITGEVDKTTDTLTIATDWSGQTAPTTKTVVTDVNKGNIASAVSISTITADINDNSVSYATANPANPS